VNEFLVLGLDEVITVVLAHLGVGACTEADDRLRACMTHINTDQHGALLGKDFRELQVVEVATSLGVDLPEDVGGLGQTELASVPEGDDLRRNLVA